MTNTMESDPPELNLLRHDPTEGDPIEDVVSRVVGDSDLQVEPQPLTQAADEFYTQVASQITDDSNIQVEPHAADELDAEVIPQMADEFNAQVVLQVADDSDIQAATQAADESDEEPELDDSFDRMSLSINQRVNPVSTQPASTLSSVNQPLLAPQLPQRAQLVPAAQTPAMTQPPASQTSAATQPPSVRSQTAPAAPGGERARTFFDDLKTDQPFTEMDLFMELNFIFSSYQHDDSAQIVKGKTPDGTEFVLQRLQEDFVHYNRVASIYTKNMHSMFVVPVWAAAYEQRSNTGYVMYPKLVSLRDFIEESSTGSDNVKKQAMRLSFMSIAAALDGLHTPVPNVRPMYYHRDLCMDNVCIPMVIRKKRGPVYGQAKLKVTRNTRGSYGYESLDVQLSVTNQRFPLTAKYYHHPDPWSDDPIKMYQYLKKHDWFSFGVYMLEVLGLLLGHPLQPGDLKDKQLSYEKVEFFDDFCTELQDIVDNGRFEDGSAIADHYTEYIDIARSCIDVLGVLTEERHVEYNYDLKNCSYHFEYPLCVQTIRLLCMFDHSGSKDSTYQEVLAENVNSTESNYIPVLCQSCMLRPTVPIPTRSYKRNSYKKAEINIRASKCDKDCNLTYCARCYVNGERLFCPRGYGPKGFVGHGTTSTVIGHKSSYALIMYGENFMNPDRMELFANDAEMLANVLTHRLICGMPKGNIVHKPLYAEGKTAKECLKNACDEMVDMIHCRRWDPAAGCHEYSDSCVNDSDFCVYIFYSGHGGSDEYEIPLGSWMPFIAIKDNSTLDQHKCVITQEDVTELLTPIRKCAANETCQGACVEIVWVADHCHASEKEDVTTSKLVKWSKTRSQSGYKERPPHVVVNPWQETRTFTMPNCDNSEITYWFCMLMRSIFFAECSKSKVNCDICNSIKKHIEDHCYGAFIDGECLEIHKRHMEKDHGQFQSRVDVSVKPVNPDDRVILAHYNEGGVYHRVFPYKEEEKSVDINFTEKVNCENIIKSIKSQFWGEGETSNQIRLLTNSSSDSSKFTLVCDHNIHDILHSTSKVRRDEKGGFPSILYYQVVKNPVTVDLFAHDVNAGDTLTLCVDRYDAVLMEYEMAKAPPTMQIPASQLPNLLVCVVYHLRHLDEYKVDPLSVFRQASRGSNYGTHISAPRDDSFPEQADAESSPTDRVRNSFASHVFEAKQTVDLKTFRKAEQWHELEENASRYLTSSRERIFKVTSPGQSRIRIEWPAQ